MAASWTQLTLVPSAEAVEALREHWGWLVPAAWQPFIASRAGDVFLEGEDGSVHWLETGGGALTRVASDRDAFRQRLAEDGGAELLLAGVVETMFEGGLVLGEGQCLGFTRLPILGGSYTPENLFPITAAEWYGFSGHIHQQLQALPDGANVRLSFE
jgi:hypothetical protein